MEAARLGEDQYTVFKPVQFWKDPMEQFELARSPPDVLRRGPGSFG